MWDLIGGKMALKWNNLSGKIRKSAGTSGQENTVTSDEVRHMINTEVRAASMKNQVVQYLGDVSAQGVRTEALIGEMKETMDISIAKIQDAIETGKDSREKLEEVQESVEKLARISQNLESTIHRDNLLTYKNIKTILDEMEDNNRARGRSFKWMVIGIALMTFISIVLSAGVLTILLGILK